MPGRIGRCDMTTSSKAFLKVPVSRLRTQGACEMSAVHSTLANLLRIYLDQKYHVDPLNSLGRPDKKRRNKWFPASAKTKWKKITDMAASAGKTELVRLIGAVYNDSVRNAFSHSDYVFSGEYFRWTESGGSSLRHGQMPLNHVNNLIDNAFSFFGMMLEYASFGWGA